MNPSESFNHVLGCPEVAKEWRKVEDLCGFSKDNPPSNLEVLRLRVAFLGGLSAGTKQALSSINHDHDH